MPFATINDLIARLDATEVAQLGDRVIPRVVTDDLMVRGASGDFSGMSSDQLTAVNKALAVINRALADASEVVKGYVATRYPSVLTMGSPPEILSRLTCDLARQALYVQGAPDHVKDAGSAARSTLRDIADGRLTLGETPEVSQQIAAPDSVKMRSSPRRFDRESSDGFI